MGWSVGYDDNWKRWIGYGVPAWCDHPDCTEEIDRGLGYVCGGEPYGGESGCGLYFCGKHLALMGFTETDGDEHTRLVCARCACAGSEPFQPKPDHPRWIEHQKTDDSWAEWRAQRTEATENAAQDLLRDPGAGGTTKEASR